MDDELIDYLPDEEEFHRQAGVNDIDEELEYPPAGEPVLSDEEIEYILKNCNIDDSEDEVRNLIVFEDCNNDVTLLDGNDIQVVFMDESNSVVTITRVSGNFTMIPRSIITRNMPSQLLVGKNLLIYLQQLNAKNKDTSISSAGHNNYTDKYGKAGMPGFKKGIGFLVKNKFLRHLGTSPGGKVTLHMILIPPVYDEDAGEFLQYSVHPFSDWSTKTFKEHYFTMPKSLFQDGVFKRLNLSDNEIRVLMLLYRYYFKDTFGGVDFRMVHRKTGRIVVHRRFTYNIHSDEKTVLRALDILEQSGLIAWKDIVISEETIENEVIRRYVKDAGIHDEVQGIEGSSKCYEVISGIRMTNEYLENLKEALEASKDCTVTPVGD